MSCVDELEPRCFGRMPQLRVHFYYRGFRPYLYWGETVYILHRLAICDALSTPFVTFIMLTAKEAHPWVEMVLFGVTACATTVDCL
jgi:hypothetical protein